MNIPPKTRSRTIITASRIINIISVGPDFFLHVFYRYPAVLKALEVHNEEQRAADKEEAAENYLSDMVWTADME